MNVVFSWLVPDDVDDVDVVGNAFGLFVMWYARAATMCGAGILK